MARMTRDEFADFVRATILDHARSTMNTHKALNDIVNTLADKFADADMDAYQVGHDTGVAEEIDRAQWY